jgi:hypothetical protein
MDIFVMKLIKTNGSAVITCCYLARNLFLVIFILLWQQQIQYIGASNYLLLRCSQSQTNMFACDKTSIQVERV